MQENTNTRDEYLQKATETGHRLYLRVQSSIANANHTHIDGDHRVALSTNTYSWVISILRCEFMNIFQLILKFDFAKVDSPLERHDQSPVGRAKEKIKKIGTTPQNVC